MTIGITFPVHETSHDVEGCPKTVPWAIVEAARGRILSAYHQTPERLYARGGLDLHEIAALIKGEGPETGYPNPAATRSAADALAIVQAASGRGKREAASSPQSAPVGSEKPKGESQ